MSLTGNIYTCIMRKAKQNVRIATIPDLEDKSFRDKFSKKHFLISSFFIALPNG